jgi:hypothetical protein
MQHLLNKGFVELGNCASGVYALIHQDEVIYIGQAMNVYQRVRAHYNRQQKMPWDRAFVCWCKPHEMKNLEAEMIRHFLPHYNSHIPGIGLVEVPQFDLLGALGIRPTKPKATIDRRDE